MPEDRNRKRFVLDVIGALIFLITVVVLVLSLLTMDERQTNTAPAAEQSSRVGGDRLIDTRP